MQNSIVERRITFCYTPTLISSQAQPASDGCHVLCTRSCRVGSIDHCTAGLPSATHIREREDTIAADAWSYLYSSETVHVASALWSLSLSSRYRAQLLTYDDSAMPK